MNCGCEHARLSSEKERIRRLAKAWAVMESETAVLCRRTDGTYTFAPIGETEEEIVEYITPY